MSLDGWNVFLALCRNAPDNAMLSKLLTSLLTPEEQSAIATRCLIIQALLAQTMRQREMSETLGMSIAKITRGSNELKRISPELKTYLKDRLLE